MASIGSTTGSQPGHDAAAQLVRGLVRTAVFVGGFVAFVAAGAWLFG
ncbi:hypothetical protein [Aeromicrobium sp. CTD01-1L150]